MSNDYVMDELRRRLAEVTNKWKTMVSEEYGGNARKWFAENRVEIQNDISDLWLLEQSVGINVVNEDGEVVASTDFTEQSKNLEVWKALGLQEEDFYK